MHLSTVQSKQLAPSAEEEERKIRFQLARLLQVSEEMLSAAQSENWQRVEELETLRSVEMEECATLQVVSIESMSDLVIEAYAALLHQNERILQLVQSARKQLQEEGSQHRVTRQAVSEYMSV